MDESLDILIVGAGPTGLACGIEAGVNNLKFLIMEKGVLVNSIYNYPSTMTFFTSRERLEIGDLPLPSLNTKPHRAEALEYYRRVADFYRLPIHFQERVMGINGLDGEFRVQTETSEGHRAEYLTHKTIIATGYYDLPNLLGIPGEELAQGFALLHRPASVLSAQSGRDWRRRTPPQSPPSTFGAMERRLP